MSSPAQAADVTTPPARSGRLLRPMMIVTVLTVAAQGIGVLTQIVIASKFGAGRSMDAYLAGVTLPQYIVTVLTSSLVVVFIPVFVEYAASHREDEAWRVASSVLNVSALVLSTIAICGIVFARPLLRLTVPGLDGEALDLAASVARASWPMIVPSGVLSLLTGVYQSGHRFTWPATTLVIGAILNLIVLVALAPVLGVVGIAVAGTMSATIQAAALVRIALGPGRYRFTLDWGHAGTREVFHLLMPLLLAGLFIRWTPVVDRYIASHLAAGSIAQLGYAFRLLGLCALLISTGLTTVVFPRLALNAATADMTALRGTISLGLRLMWLVVAPATVLGAVLAQPLVSLAFQRGHFTTEDAHIVAQFLRVYLLALAAMCLGNISGRILYALKRTRLVAGIGLLEALAYAIYTAVLANRFGAEGVALGYVIYFNVSILWQIVWIRAHTGGYGGRRIVVSYARIGLAAIAAGCTAQVAMMSTPHVLIQLTTGTLAGIAIYIALLFLLRSDEAYVFRSILNVGRGAR